MLGDPRLIQCRFFWGAAVLRQVIETWSMLKGLLRFPWVTLSGYRISAGGKVLARYISGFGLCFELDVVFTLQLRSKYLYGTTIITAL